MADDALRVHAASLARQHSTAGVRGAQDGRLCSNAARERRAGKPGPAHRLEVRGCAACLPHSSNGIPGACNTCDGWKHRKRRDGRCRTCGAHTLCSEIGNSVACQVCHLRTPVHVRGKRPAPPAPPSDPDSAALWQGFARLSNGTVARLLRAGDDATVCDVRAAACNRPRTPATARHIHGGECPRIPAAGTAAAARHVRRMQRHVASWGGRASALMGQLAAAAAYLECPAHRRQELSAAHWDAYHAVVAGDLINPDWMQGDPDANPREPSPRSQLADALAPHIVEIGTTCTALRLAWRDAATKEVAWREAQEQGRELARLCIRAWREVTDDALAGKPNRAHRWSDPARYTLARRLPFPAFPNGPSHGVDCPCKKCRAVPREGWRTDAWAAWFVLAWLRLVRATHSRRTAAWHGAQHERRRKLRTGSDTGDAAAGTLGDTRTNRADARTHRRHSQQQHSWVNDQLPPERLRCYWGCRGECRPAVHSTPPTDGEESDGDKSSSGGHEGDGSTRSDADAGAPAKRRRVGHDTPTDVPAAPQTPRRTRRTDTILQLRAPARLALHIRLADADARLTHGRKRRSDT